MPDNVRRRIRAALFERLLDILLKQKLQTAKHGLESLSVELGYGEPTHRDKVLLQEHQRLIHEEEAIILLLSK